MFDFCSFLFHFDGLDKLSTNYLREWGKYSLFVVIEIILVIPFQLFFVKTVLTISVKVTDLCRGDILTSNKIFDIMAHILTSEIHHSIKVDGTVQYTLQKESLLHRDPLSAFSPI